MPTGLSGHDRERWEQEAGRLLFRFAVSVLCTAPLAGNLVAEMLGWHIFFLADPKIQCMWASIVQLWAGWPFYTGSYRFLRGGGAWSDLLVALGTSAAYAYSLYNTFFNKTIFNNTVFNVVQGGAGRTYYEAAALVITLVILGRLRGAAAQGRRN